MHPTRLKREPLYAFRIAIPLEHSHQHPHSTPPYRNTAKMIRHDFSRVDPKRRADVNYKKKQFANAEYQHQDYEHRLNFYILPPTADVTLEEFETWAIQRLKGTIPFP